MARMVCLWLPNWPLQRLRHERPELKDRPVVLFSNTGHRGPRVVAWSDATSKHKVLASGVASAPRCSANSTKDRGADAAPLACLTPGMPLAEAEALLAGRDVPAHIEQHDPAADVAGLRELARTCNSFSPLFGIEAAESPECVLLDVTGCEHLFGGEQNLVAALTRDFQQRGFQVRAALAPTIGAAWAAAHYRSPTPCGSVDSRTNPNQPGHKGLGYESLEETLAPLPVTALRLPIKIVETLRELGLHRIGQLRALPRESLPSRFGSELLHRLDQAFGNVPELLIPERPAEPIAVTWVTDEPLTDRESLRFICRELIDELIGRLKPRREGARQLLCQVKGTAARPVEMLVSLVSPSDATKHLLELLGLQIDRADLPEGISFVRLEATSIESLATWQRDLFGLEADTDTHREVSSLLDRLSNRLGATAVAHAALVPDAQPELSVRYKPCDTIGSQASGAASAPRLFAARTPTGGLTPNGTRFVSGTALAAGSSPVIVDSELPVASAIPLKVSTEGLTPPRSPICWQARPLRLFAPPQRIEATTAGPEGAPMRFHWERREYRVIRSWGPERIETGWWRDQSICRDYFRVETQTGQHFWLFRSFEQAAWFIHGAFD